MDFLSFVFSSFWTFIGAFMMLGVVCGSLVRIVQAIFHKGKEDSN